MILAIIFFGVGAIGLTIFMIDTSSIDALPMTAIIWTIFLALLITKIAKNIDERREEQKISEYYKNKQQYNVAPYRTYTGADRNQTVEKNEANYQTKSLLTPAEEEYAQAIQYCLPTGYILQPQVCLASVIKKTANTQYANELFRIIDFGIFDENFQIKALIEINDNSHLESNRRRRDSKVKKICEEAQIPLITFWMHYGIDYRYIKKRICQAIYGL